VSGGLPDRRAAEDAPRVDVLDGALDGIAIVRQGDGTIVYANVALKALLGASPDELTAGVTEPGARSCEGKTASRPTRAAST
jgi:PAS domain-containing protein